MYAMGPTSMAFTFVELELVLVGTAMQRLSEGFGSTKEDANLSMLSGVCSCELSKYLIKVGAAVVGRRSKACDSVSVARFFLR